jgi:hypothetical protein
MCCSATMPFHGGRYDVSTVRNAAGCTLCVMPYGVGDIDDNEQPFVALARHALQSRAAGVFFKLLLQASGWHVLTCSVLSLTGPVLSRAGHQNVNTGLCRP